MKFDRLLLFCVAATLGACATVNDTRNFANSASELMAYRDLTLYWAATYERERRFLFDADLAQSKSEHDVRQTVVPDVLNIHATVARYFTTLAQLAGDEANATGPSADAAAKSIKQLPLTGLNDQYVDAYAKLANLIAAGYQRHLIANYVRDGDAPLQTLLAGMRQVLRVYQGTLRNELGRAGFLTLVEHDTPQGKTLAALANAEYRRVEIEIETTRKRIDALDAAIIKIGEGHQKLVADVELNRDDVKRALRKITDELDALHSKIQTLRD